MSIEKRPYVGTWTLNNKQVYQHAPDCLVYLNGDVTIPNAVNNGRQQSRINFQKFITQVSVDAGTQPGSASASISLSIPVHSNDSFVRDANFILRPGLEVHVYMRGYFPAQGMFSRNEDEFEPVANETSDQGVDPAGRTGQGALFLRQLGKPDKYVSGNFRDIQKDQLEIYRRFKAQMNAEYSQDRVLGITQAMCDQLGLDANKMWAVFQAESGVKQVAPYTESTPSTAWGIAQILNSSFGGVQKGAKKSGKTVWWEHGDLFNPSLVFGQQGSLPSRRGWTRTPLWKTLPPSGTGLLTPMPNWWPSGTKPKPR